MSLRLDDFLRRRKADIITAWEAEVRRRLPGAEGMSGPALVDEIPELLDRLAEEMGRPEPSGTRVSPVSRRHAELRVTQQVPPSRVIDECRILRDVTLAMATEEAEALPGGPRANDASRRMDGLARLVLALDDAARECIRHYLEIRDRHTAEVEQRLRLAIESADIGTWDLDVRSGQFRWDDRCRSMFGLPDQLEGAYQRFIAAVHPEDRERVAQAAGASLRGLNAGEYRAEYRIHRGDDRAIRWITARGAALFDENGRAVRFIGTVMDVTDAKAAEEIRERFIGMLGHDLRTPLGTISMAADHMLRSGQLPAQIHRSAVVIARAAERMARMIRDLLDLARGRLGGAIPISPAPSDAGEICRQVAEETEVLHPARSIALHCEGDLEGRWDSDRLAQAIGNLVANAVTHGRDPIVVRARGEGDEVAVEVSNAGPPIPAHERPYLFDAFRRARTGRGRASGLGLGLYIVSEIVSAHGGAVSVRSDESGTTFVLRLPRGT
jgi:PAS domain S-box-containing protein